MKFPTMDEFAQMVADKAIDEVEYNGKTLRQWIEIISASEHGTNLSSLGTDCISRQQAIDAVKDCYCGGEDSCGEPWIYEDHAIKAIKQLPPANCSEFPNSSDTISRQGYTEEELRVFQHGISLSLLSKRSAQHWRYDEDTATEIEFLERLYDKVSADMKGGQG